MRDELMLHPMLTLSSGLSSRDNTGRRRLDMIQQQSLRDRQGDERAANKSQPSQKVVKVSPTTQTDGALNQMLSHKSGHSSS